MTWQPEKEDTDQFDYLCEDAATQGHDFIIYVIALGEAHAYDDDLSRPNSSILFAQSSFGLLSECKGLSLVIV